MLGFNILQSLLKIIRYKQVKTLGYEYNIKGKLPQNQKKKLKKKMFIHPSMLFVAL